MTISVPVRPVVVRRNVPVRADYSEYRQDLRFDFWYACAYCSIAETEALGIGFHIDHYVPHTVDSTLKHAYSNLMWGCARCNRNKTNYFPNATQTQMGYVIIRVDQDDPRRHYQLNGEELKDLTPTGNFNILMLNLNCLEHKRLRRLRKRLWNAQCIIANGIVGLFDLRLDELPQKIRPHLQRLREQTAEDLTGLEDDLGAIIRALSHSELLDPDPDHEATIRIRKQYLDSIKAITPKLGK